MRERGRGGGEERASCHGKQYDKMKQDVGEIEGG